MRYQIFSLQQKALVDLGLNVEEALLLDWILNWKDGTGMKREFIEEQQDIGYWINYETVVNELPILFKQPTDDMDEKALKKLLRNNKDKVGRLLKGNLSKVLTPHKMVYRGDKNKLGSMVFVVINREAIDMLKNTNSKNKKAPTFAEVEASKNLKNNDNNIIPKDNNNIQLIQEKKEKENDLYDIKEIAYARCLLEYEGFESFDNIRKDFFVNMMINKICKEGN
jgi:hypothetical protein